MIFARSLGWPTGHEASVLPMKRARIPDTVPNAADNASQLLFAIMFDHDHLAYLPHPSHHNTRYPIGVAMTRMLCSNPGLGVVGHHDRADFHLGVRLAA